MHPGLSGALPRCLADGHFDSVTELTVHIDGCDRLTAAAAMDYLDSLRNGFGQSHVAWAGGRRVMLPRSRASPIAIQDLPRPVVISPYLTAEAERIAKPLGISNLRWYAVF